MWSVGQTLCAYVNHNEGTDVGHKLCMNVSHKAGTDMGQKSCVYVSHAEGTDVGQKSCVFLCTKYKDKSEGTHNSYALVPNHSEKHGKQCVGTHVAYICMCTCVFDKL